ncbi:MAG TPA: YfhO family protein [Thermoanaerobaculia bacterium]|nr:YfhO family protein [Thermoanaerobaculia bacterium]
MGALLLVAAVRWWRPQVSKRAALAYVALVAAFFAVPLFTGALQIPTDIIYSWLPWRAAVARRPVPLNPLLSDIVLQELPYRSLVRSRLLALEAPLWANEMGAGQPLLANGQSTPFAPLHLLALPLPTPRAFAVSVAWEILLELLLMHALLLRLGAGWPGAAFGAVAGGLSTFMIAWAYYPLAMTAAWIPGLLLGILLLRHGERGSFAGLVACGVGLAASGQPEILGFTALAAAAFAVVVTLRPSPGRGRFILRLLAAGMLTACLAAPLLLPIVEQLPHSQRMENVRHSPDAMQPPAFEARMALPLLDPLAFGSPRDGNWSGPWNFNELCSDYAGLLALAVALAGAAIFRGRIAGVLLGGLLALLASLRIFPVYNLIHSVPLVGEAAAGRLRIFWVLAVAVAGGLSVERLAGDRRGRIAGAVMLIATGAALAILPPPDDAPWQRVWWLAALLGAAAALATLLLPVARQRFALVALAALLLDLALLGMRFNPVPDRDLDLSPPPSLAFLMDRARSSPEPFRVLADGYDLKPNLAAVYGLWDPRSCDPMQVQASARFVNDGLRSSDGEQRLAVESYLGVRYRLLPKRRQLPAPWQPVFHGPGGWIWENPQAQPLFVLPAQEGTVRSIRAGSNQFTLEAESATGGTVISSVSYVPGWQVEMDGRRSPAFEVNAAFLGFKVPPGRHAVCLVYRPAGWIWGLVLFGLGVAGAVILSRATLQPDLPDRRPLTMDH